jgi:hypothetical protein
VQVQAVLFSEYQPLLSNLALRNSPYNDRMLLRRASQKWRGSTWWPLFDETQPSGGTASVFRVMAKLNAIKAAGVSTDDRMITLYEAPGENFSFGRDDAQRAIAVPRA